MRYLFITNVIRSYYLYITNGRIPLYHKCDAYYLYITNGIPLYHKCDTHYLYITNWIHLQLRLIGEVYRSGCFNRQCSIVLRQAPIVFHVHQVLLFHAIDSLSWAFYDLGDMNYTGSLCVCCTVSNSCPRQSAYLLISASPRVLFATITQSINVFPACYPFSPITCSVHCVVLYLVLYVLQCMFVYCSLSYTLICPSVRDLS